VGGVHPNHFYQSSSLNRDANTGTNNYSSQQVQSTQGVHHMMQSTNNSNFNSLDYSELAMSSRRMHNESNSNGVNVNSSTIQQQQITQANVKRNNFLAMFNGAMEESGVKSPESHSQPNPPTLRKITLNQRILQKNMARVSTQN
jgi:membrane-bound lytic murein transglycosylase B